MLYNSALTEQNNTIPHICLYLLLAPPERTMNLISRVTCSEFLCVTIGLGHVLSLMARILFLFKLFC